MECATVVVTVKGKKADGEQVINASDYDASIHVKAAAKKPAKKKPAKG